jgi:hypothetical protein
VTMADGRVYWRVARKVDEMAGSSAA